MATATGPTPRTVRKLLNEANPNKLEVGWALLPAGEAMSLLPRSVRTAPGGVASNALVLPDEAKGCVALKGYAIDGTATGPLDGVQGAPAAGEVAIDPITGNAIFNAVDAVTQAEVTYTALEGAICEEQIQVLAAGGGVLLGGRAGVLLLSAELLTGATPGVKTIEARGTAPGAGEAALDDDGTSVLFVAGEVGAGGGTALVRYIATPGVGNAPDAVGSQLDNVDPVT